MADPAEISQILAVRIDRVIGEVLAENGGGFCDGWVAWVDYTSAEGKPAYAETSAPDQLVTRSLAQARCLSLAKDRQIVQMLEGDNE